MRRYRSLAAIAGGMFIALASGAPYASASEEVGPTAPATQPPAAASTPDANSDPKPPAGLYEPETDPWDQGPGCPLRDDDPPRLLIG